MPCKPGCMRTATIDNKSGHRLMISVAGNKKFPIPHTSHGQCRECVEAELLEAITALAASGDPDAQFQFDRQWLENQKKGRV